MRALSESGIGIAGLGYPGLPLVSEVGQVFDTVGFDISPFRIKPLENCVDLRSTLVSRHALQACNKAVDVDDPWVNGEEANHADGLSLLKQTEQGDYGTMILPVGHQQSVGKGARVIRALGKETSVDD